MATCYCRASTNQPKTYVNTERWTQDERKEKINSWKEEECKTRLLAALILGILLFWVPTSACDIADAFTHKLCLLRSVYLLCTLLVVNVSYCVKPLIIAHMDEDLVIEFKRILKLRKSRNVGIGSNPEGSRLEEDPKFMPETRKYYCKMEKRRIKSKDGRVHCMTLERKLL